MTSDTSPYGSSPAASSAASPTTTAAAAGPSSVKRVRTRTLQEFKDRGEKFTMITSYDSLTAQIFDASGIDLLLVGDSAANNVMGESTTLPITVEEMLVFTKAVSRGAHRALVVADLPFGSYENSPQQAFETAVRFMKEAGAHALKLEGGVRMADTVRHLTNGGIPVVAHIGFTPQSEHVLGGYRVQGRDDQAAKQLVTDALALEAAGAVAVLLEMVPATAAAAVESALRIPTIGIGAGSATTGQVLVWQDAMGLREGKLPRFVKQFAHLAEELKAGTEAYIREVKNGSFPAPEHTF